MAKTAKPDPGDILISKVTGFVDGLPVRAGITRVRAGHAMAKNHPELFEAVDVLVHYDVEQATAAPGEHRGASGKAAVTEAITSPKGDES
jgi:hypothetical protein